MWCSNQALNVMDKNVLLITASLSCAATILSFVLGISLVLRERKLRTVIYLMLPLIQLMMLLYFQLTPLF